MADEILQAIASLRDDLGSEIRDLRAEIRDLGAEINSRFDLVDRRFGLVDQHFGELTDVLIRHVTTLTALKTAVEGMREQLSLHRDTMEVMRRDLHALNRKAEAWVPVIPDVPKWPA